MKTLAIVIGASFVLPCFACGQSAPPPAEPPSNVPVATAASSSPPVPTPSTSAPTAAASAPTSAGDDTGTGAGASGHGEGIGLGNMGTSGEGGAGDGGKTAGKRKPPSIRQGATMVNGRLPPEVIQRIIRQSAFGRFRLCYENGLRTNPTLQGRVATKFVIDKNGAVSDPQDGGSDLPDQAVVKCVNAAFAGVSFPKPESGVVTVVYPILLSPGGD